MQSFLYYLYCSKKKCYIHLVLCLPAWGENEVNKSIIKSGKTNNYFPDILLLEPYRILKEGINDWTQICCEVTAFATCQCQCHFFPGCFVFSAGNGFVAHRTQWTSVLSSVENPTEIEVHLLTNILCNTS